MTRLTLLLRNLLYFRGVNLAVVAGMAVATAVLTGALMVGDSVRGSLADLALRRLGAVDYALITTQFFDQSLAGRIDADSVAPAMIVRGGAVNDSVESSEKPRTADVQIAAIGGKAGAIGVPLPRGQALINGELAQNLSVNQPNDAMLLTLPREGDAPREATLARRSHDDVLNILRTNIQNIDRDSDFAALFNPSGGQRMPRNAWVNLQDLQGATEQPGRANALLVRAKDPAERPADAVAALNAQLRKVIELGDYGLESRPGAENEVSLFSRQIYISPPVVDAARRAAAAAHAPLREVSVNLINSVTRVSADSPQSKVIHYAVAAGISSLTEGLLGDGDIALNEWAAGQLGAKVGDTLRIDFYLRQADGDLSDASKSLPPQRLAFTLKYILPMSGIGGDRGLPPVYKGLTDADTIAKWDRPEDLKIDQSLVTPDDEKYWEQYRAAPKVILSFDTARRLWGGVYGDVTGLRVPADKAASFLAHLKTEIDPQSQGMVFRPIKAQQLAAATGGTDFSMFFLMFSFFLIVAAVLLVAMLFRLNVEQRARQLGLLAATGFTRMQLVRQSLFEGLLLAVIGGAIGLLLAAGYTWLILLGLRTWWIGAVGTTAMTLHVVPLTLAYGFIGSLFVASLAIMWAVWRIGKTSAARLLAGAWGMAENARRDGRWVRWAGIICGLLALGIVAAALVARRKVSAEAGFGGGALLLCGSLAYLGGALRPRRHAGVAFLGAGSLVRVGIRNAARHTGRGVLSVGLIGFAAFTLITVAALKQQGVTDAGKKDTGTGGYRLILNAGIPLNGDLNTTEGRKVMGMRGAGSDLYKDVHFTPLRQWAGQDISCLNLTRPTAPTILGLPPSMIQRGGFIPGESLQKTNNFWSLLDSDQGDSIPVIADSDTQEYVLQIPLGGTLDITDQLGVPRKLKLVATVAHSIFQGQLLMGEGNFRKLFPAQSGYGVVLIDAPPEKESEIAKRLSSELEDYSVSVETTSSRLQTYQDVQNTYMETFQTLGALGLMLGTLGLAVVLVRTVLERRPELALLASLGFTSAARLKLILSENGFLLITGLWLGSVSAVIGILPTVIRDTRPINVPYLAGTLLAVLAVGLISSTLAVLLSGLHVSPSDLRSD